MKKIVISLLILFSISILFSCEKKPPVDNNTNNSKIEIDKPIEEIVEEELGEDVVLIENLKADISIFGDIGEVEFDWHTENGIVKVQGYELKTIEKVTNDSQVLQYFKDRGMEMDSWNMAAGTISYLEGYQKGDLVCTVLIDSGEEADIFTDQPLKSDITVNCGLLVQ